MMLSTYDDNKGNELNITKTFEGPMEIKIGQKSVAEHSDEAVTGQGRLERQDLATVVDAFLVRLMKRRKTATIATIFMEMAGYNFGAPVDAAILEERLAALEVRGNKYTLVELFARFHRNLHQARRTQNLRIQGLRILRGIPSVPFLCCILFFMNEFDLLPVASASGRLLLK